MNNLSNFLSYWRVFGKRIFVLAMIVTIGALAVFAPQINRAQADDGDIHTITVKAETENDRKGKFTYRIKAHHEKRATKAYIIGYVGEEGREYTTNFIDIDDYELVGDSGNTSGVIDDRDIEVIYYYRLIEQDEPVPEPEEPDVPVPNTGTNSTVAGSVAKAGVVALTVILITLRVAYLIRRHREKS